MTDQSVANVEEDIENRFQFHQPSTDKTRSMHEWVRASCKSFAYDLSEVLPKSREASLVLTKLEELMFWANAAIARTHEKE